MIIQAIPSGPFETNAYILGCPKTRLAAIIDPAPGSLDPISDFLTKNSLTPTQIILTHSHWDHIADTAALKRKYQIPVLIHALDAENLKTPGSDGLPCWIAIEGVNPDKFIEDGDSIAIGESRFNVIHTPGHTPGGICLYNSEEETLISGDTLFQGSIGNLSFPTARPELMWSSLDKLSQLPAKTRFFPGHGPNSTIGAETWLPNARTIFGNSY